MILKIWFTVLILVLLMLSSEAVAGEPLQEGVTIDGIYYGKGYDPENSVLFIGGILQKGPNPDDNPDEKKFADDNHAMYDPAYYSGGLNFNIKDYEKIKKDALAVNAAALGIKSDYNGLESPTLENGKHYDKIIAYSGGTATALTALAQQGVTCDTLVLISPMSAGVPNAELKIEALLSAEKTAMAKQATEFTKYARTGPINEPSSESNAVIDALYESEKIKAEAKQIAHKNFDTQINKILIDLAAAKNIVIVQSDDDSLLLGDVFQYKFPLQEKGSKITVYDVDLDGIAEVLGFKGHEKILQYANDNILNPPVTADILSVGFQESSAILDESDIKGTIQTIGTSDSVDHLGDTSSSDTGQKSAYIDSVAYKSTIPIPTGSVADALKAQGKYEEYLENALQSAEERIIEDPNDGDAWHTKALALEALGKTTEANDAFAKARLLGSASQSSELSDSIEETSPTDTPQSDTKGTTATSPVAVDAVTIGTPDSSAKFGDTSSSDTGQDTEGTTQTTPVAADVVTIGTPDSSARFGETSPTDTAQTDTKGITKTSPVTAEVAAFGSPDSIDRFGETSSSDTVQSDTKGTNQKSPVAAEVIVIGSPQSSAVLEGTSDQASTQEAGPLAAETQETSPVVADVLSLGFLQGLQPIAEAASQSTGESSLSVGSGTYEGNLGGINFTSIKLNSIAVSIDQDKGVNFDLILKSQKAKGVNPVIDPINATLLGATAFMTGLIVPNYRFWVNLNPWEADRIIDEPLRQSEVGRVMLEADLQMKRDFGNYVNPCANETIKAFWNLLDKKKDELVQQCMNEFPGEIRDTNNIGMKGAIRLWIVPDKVYAYTNGTQIYIINTSLTINSECDLDHANFEVYFQDISTLSEGCQEKLNESARKYMEYFKELGDRMILPYVITDVNQCNKYENLREVYVALALAQWYKSKMNTRMDIFRDFLDSSSSEVLKSKNVWSTKEIWERYINLFENCEFECWENETIKTTRGIRILSNPRCYGGVEFNNIKDQLIKIEQIPSDVQELSKRAITEGVILDGKDVFFGCRLHMAPKYETSISSTSPGSSPNHMKSKEIAAIHLNKNTKESKTNHPRENLLIQKNGEAPQEVEAASKSSACPDGWMGPDEKGECWELQIMS